MNKREETRKKWEEIVGRCEEAKMSQMAFAAAHKLSFPALRYWIYKLRAERSQGSPKDLPVRFVPVDITGAPRGASIELRLGEVTIALPDGASTGYVAELAWALRRSMC